MNALPFVDPVDPVKKDMPWNDPAWFFDFKNDGHRGIGYWNGGRLWFKTKEGNDHTFKWLERKLVRCLRIKGIRDAIFDGEIVAPDSTGRQIFADVRKGHEVYVAFDIMWLDGRDLRGLPFIVRRNILEGVVALEKASCIQGPFARRENGLETFKWIIENDYEGLVAKRADSIYDVKRAGWIKILNPYYSQNEYKKTLKWGRSRP